MSRRRVGEFRVGAVAWLGLVFWAFAAGAVEAQFIGVDPYDPWNAMYRPFVNPYASREGSAIPNQSRLGAGMGIGTGSRDLSIDGAGGIGDPTIGPGGTFGGRFTPYYLRSHRFNQTTPGAGAGESRGRERAFVANRDDQFFAQQQEREAKFFEALRERDPKRRAELLRKLNEATRSAVRSSSSLRGQERAVVPETTEPVGEAGAAVAPGLLDAPGSNASEVPGVRLQGSGTSATGRYPGTTSLLRDPRLGGSSMGSGTRPSLRPRMPARVESPEPSVEDTPTPVVP